MRYQEGAEKYSLGLTKFQALAKEAKATYKIDKVVLVNCEIFENRVISINHSLVYYPANGSNKCVLRVSLPKTDAGIRTIPMLDIVKDAFEMLYEEQKENGFNETEIDGMTGFIFCNRFGSVPNPQTVNHTIKRIANNYNADEVVRAKKEHRDPIILPNFSCHHFRGVQQKFEKTTN